MRVRVRSLTIIVGRLSHTNTIVVVEQCIKHLPLAVVAVEAVAVVL